MRDYLVNLRKSKNMSQGEVAKELDISEPYYQMIEAGKRQKKMDITLAAKISALFSVSLDYVEKEERAVRNLSLIQQ